MKTDASLKESKSHGTPQYAFEMYRMADEKYNIFVTAHWHDDIEIIYVTGGTLHISISNKSYTGAAGDIFFINKGEMHEMYGQDTSLNYTAFVFDAAYLSFMTEDLAQKQFISPINNGNIHFFHQIKSNPFAEEILKRITQLNTEKPYSYTLGTKASLLQFMSMLIDNGLYIAKEDNTETKSEFLKKIISYINDRCTEQIPLSEIAREFNMSAKYFCRFFKNSFNKTFVEYVNAVRIEHAMKILADRDITITEAALSCGFSNMSYFTRTFKKITGFTPSGYRKTIF